MVTYSENLGLNNQSTKSSPASKQKYRQYLLLVFTRPTMALHILKMAIKCLICFFLLCFQGLFHSSTVAGLVKGWISILRFWEFGCSACGCHGEQNHMSITGSRAAPPESARQRWATLTPSYCQDSFIPATNCWAKGNETQTISFQKNMLLLHSQYFFFILGNLKLAIMVLSNCTSTCSDN